MNEPQYIAIEQTESEVAESVDSDLSDEALDRPLGPEVGQACIVGTIIRSNDN